MVILAVQQVFLSRSYPLLAAATLAFGTMTVAATVVGYPFFSTSIASLQMSAKCGCAALNDAPQYLGLSGMYFALFFKRISILSDDICQLKLCPHRSYSCTNCLMDFCLTWASPGLCADR